MKKRIYGFILVLAILAGCFSACGKSKAASVKRFSVVCTIFPEYDWVREVVGDSDDYDISFLLDTGVDLHNYQPNAADMVKISSCDMFIYVGGESDEWVEDALASAVNERMVVINLLDSLGDLVKEEELVEGMQGEEEEEDGEEEGPEYDEHVWLSVKNAQKLVEVICDAVCELDPENESSYRGNAKAYGSKLSELDRSYAQTAEAAKVKTVLFGDRFPFRYMIDDYGLGYYAAFIGCSAETEASFETITFLAGKVDELSLKHVLVIEGADKKIAETIISSTRSKDQDVIVMDSIQSVTKADVEKGVTYLEIMEKNLEALKKALN